jgi:hypothetical protein
MNSPTQVARSVLAVLGDSAEAAQVIEWSAALARALGRELLLVYVESTPALCAAALADTRVLAHVGAPWTTFAQPDVERGFRAEAARLRALAAAAALRHDLRWSLRTLRGALPHAALALRDEADLVFVGSALPFRPLAQRRPPGQDLRGLRLATAVDDSAAGERGLGMASQLAQVLSASLEVLRLAAGADPDESTRLAGLQRADLLVLPHSLATARSLARTPCPALLVA